MKRLIPATLIFIFIIAVCIGAHMYVDNACDQTINDIENYYNQSITGDELEEKWQERKENMALFVNHNFLDKISVYIGQLTLTEEEDNSPEFDTVYKNIESILELIKAEQKFALHSFY
ncbi:MAG: DUF4363 family protein [Clostridia bacterium]|nr:DUF4363 family protein [Clostridia bacterium]